MKKHWIYLLASKKNGTLYIGVTSNLTPRIYEHKQDLIPGFTKIYKVNQLVYVEQSSTMMQAITREKQLKHWNRDWKIKLIEEKNPAWYDLSYQILEGML